MKYLLDTNICIYLIKRKPESVIQRLEALPSTDIYVHADLAKKGRLIGSYDLQIAGQAKRRGLTLITNNMKEFERVNGLKLENWV